MSIAETNTEHRLAEAVARIRDMLEEDDGQAFKEARKFLDKLENADREPLARPGGDIRRFPDEFVGRVPAIGKHRAINWAHLVQTVAHLDSIGEHEAADTIVWQAWWRFKDAQTLDFFIQTEHERHAPAETMTK